ncbi:hypothetical protein [Spirochaeta dissipatitropha]
MMHGMGFGMGFFMMLVPLFVFGVGGFTLYRLYQLRHRRNAGENTINAGTAGSTETAVYRLAASRKGALTVSDVVVGLGMDALAAENLLQSMVDYQRVRMEVSDAGKVVYEFPELLPDSEKGDKDV